MNLFFAPLFAIIMETHTYGKSWREGDRKLSTWQAYVYISNIIFSYLSIINREFLFIFCSKSKSQYCSQFHIIEVETENQNY